METGTPGITVSKASGNTTEAGGKATFTVKLDSKPTSSVTVHFDSNNQGEGKVDKTSLMFTTDNWGSAQTVTVTGQDDMIADGDQSYSVVFSATTTDDTNYAAITPSAVKLSNVDNDSAGITVGKISGKTGEDGTTATFTVVLNSQPGGDVTVNFDSDNSDEGKVDPTSLTFTMDNWMSPQTATVTGVDDSVADGDQKFHITFGATTSMDARYAGLTPDDLEVTNTDNDSAGYVVSEASGHTSEGGDTATFTIKLVSQPKADVTLHFDSSDKDEGTVDKTSITFTKDNWNSTQTVTVTGVDDDIADGNQDYNVSFGDTTSDDEEYAAHKPGDVHFTNNDNDSAAVTVGSISGDTSENGTPATFTVVLNSQPTADVTIALTSSNTAEGTVDPATLTFTSDNWNAAQTVTVTGVDDTVADGDQDYAIQFAAATSDDDAYNGKTIEDVAIKNLDDDTNGITVSAISGDTGENGTQANFTVRLRTQPSGNVVVHFASSDTTEGTTDKTSLTFTTVNWNAPQTVTVTGVDDNLDDGPIVYSIAFTATTGADGYAGMTPSSVTVRNIDNDTAGVTVGAISGNTGEDGTQAHFTVVLNAQPSADVTVHFDSNNRAEGIPNRTSLTFTSANWNAPQTVNVTGQDDSVADGRQAYAIVFTANTSSDAAYAAITPTRVTVNNVDNDSAAITVSNASGSVRENGTQATFTVVLSSQPTANVVLTLHSDDTTEGTIDKSTLTFTAVNYRAPQTVTVSGVQDALADGNQQFHIVFDHATSTDSNYAAITPTQVTVTNIDDDSPGITVSAISGDTDEGGRQATFTVQLDSQPFSPVTVNFASSNSDEGVTTVPSVTFTASNWNAPQTVTVTGSDDAVQDGNQPFTIMFMPTTSSDAAYAGLTPGNIDVVNDDNDSAGITVSAISRNTRESGTQARFTVVLNSQPTGDVTVHFATSNAAEGTTGVTSLTFTDQNWNALQTVNVTGQDDNVQDGDQPYSIVFSATTSSDPNYDQLTPSSVAVTNVDNDTAGLTVSLISGNTTEGGGQATFTAVLNSQPTGNVTLHFMSNDTTEGTTDVTALTFTSANWNAVQTVTLSGQNDDVADGTQPYSVVFAATTSSDALYNGLLPANVLIYNTDNDTAGINVGAIVGSTTEAGVQAHFTVVLNSQPTDDVTVNFMSNDTTEGTTTVSSLTFTSVNWAAPQTVNVTGVDDNVQDGNQGYRIVFSATTSTDANYAAITPQYVSVTNNDNDSVGITVGPISGNTTEAGVTATFSIVLTSQPTADVNVNYHSSNTAEGTLTSGVTTFTASNWNAPVTVTVTGVDDHIADGTQGYAIVFDPVTSSDPLYAALTPPSNVSVSNTDNDTAGIDVTAISGATSEPNTQATFSVSLHSQPTADVTVHFTSSDTTEGTIAVSSLTFTSANWNAPQTVIVTGADDLVADGNQPYAITFSPTTSADTNYNGVTPGNVVITNNDNDTAGFTVVVASHTTSEPTGTATFTVKLNSQPTASVTVNFATSDASEGLTDATSLVFTTVNYNSAQTVTVTGQDDAIADGNQPYSIHFTTTTGSDGTYAALTPTDISMTNNDDDTAGIIVSPIVGHTTEGGGQATFTVKLQSQPTANVTVNFASDTPSEGTTNVPSLTFTSVNYNANQTVTLTGVDDLIADGNQPYFVNFSSTTSTDTTYAAITPTHVAVSNYDDDTAGFIVGSVVGSTSESGGTATFTVRLASQPVGTVVINYASDDLTEGHTVLTHRTFDTSSWNTNQTITVVGNDDNVQDGPQGYHVHFTATTGTDPVYPGVSLPADVSITNTDDDTVGFTLGAITGHTTEAGGTATFTVRLNSQPTNGVTVNYHSDDTGEGTVSPASLMFSTANWNMPQTVTVTGVDDVIADNNQSFNVVFDATMSSDSLYAAIKPSPDVAAINDDNDSASISVSLISGHTSEAGGTATFTVVLTSQPSANVDLGFSSDTPTEGTAATSPLTFTMGNWNMPQTVTVTGQDDAVVDGPVPYSITFTPASSTDLQYNGLTPSAVAVTNDDDDDPCGAHGGEYATVVASHIIVCSDFEDYPTVAGISGLPNGWSVCTDTAWTANADATPIPDSLWLLYTANVCGGGDHEVTDSGCPSNMMSCYDPGAVFFCYPDFFSFRFAVCK